MWNLLRGCRSCLENVFPVPWLSAYAPIKFYYFLRNDATESSKVSIICVLQEPSCGHMICSTCLDKLLSTPKKTTVINGLEDYIALQKEAFSGALKLIKSSDAEFNNHWVPVNRINDKDHYMSFGSGDVPVHPDYLPYTVYKHIHENGMIYIPDRVTDHERPQFAKLILELQSSTEKERKSLEKIVTEKGEAQLKDLWTQATESLMASRAKGDKCPCPICNQLTLDKDLPPDVTPVAADAATSSSSHKFKFFFWLVLLHLFFVGFLVVVFGGGFDDPRHVLYRNICVWEIFQHIVFFAVSDRPTAFSIRIVTFLDVIFLLSKSWYDGDFTLQPSAELVIVLTICFMKLLWASCQYDRCAIDFHGPRILQFGIGIVFLTFCRLLLGIHFNLIDLDLYFGH